jgi:hypothetical protein
LSRCFLLHVAGTVGTLQLSPLVSNRYNAATAPHDEHVSFCSAPMVHHDPELVISSILCAGNLKEHDRLIYKYFFGMPFLRLLYTT